MQNRDSNSLGGSSYTDDIIYCMAYARREDQLEANRLHYLANKEKYVEKSRQRRKGLSLIVQEAKARPCVDCKNSYPYYVMQFDHVRWVKKFNLGKYYAHGLQQILEEIAKCEVVCANCHALRTWSRANHATVD